MTEHVSLAVIGAGSGNMLIPDDRSVALFEEGPVGGTCVNQGCIPSKMLLYTAGVARSVRTAATFDLTAELRGVDWPAIRDRVFAKTDGIARGGRDHRRQQDNVSLYEERARFVGPHELETASGARVRADQIVIATGGRPVIPEPIRRSGVTHHTSDDIMRLTELPRHLLILGGGYIAVEQAQLFSSLGVEVTILEAMDELLSGMDETVTEAFTALASKRWTVHTGVNVSGASERNGRITLEVDGGPAVEGDALLVAAGRAPNTDDLGLDTAGVEVDDHGQIVVDRYGRAGEGLWALGDCIGTPKLKHVANAEARIVAHNLTAPTDLWNLPDDDVPAAVFAEPEVASVGARRQDLTDRPFVEGCRPFSDVAYGWAMQDETGFCRIYADPETGLLLGAHILGPHASLLITPLVQAIAHGQRARDLARGQYWIHPALSEVVEQALLALDLPDDVRSGQRH